MNEKTTDKEKAMKISEAGDRKVLVIKDVEYPFRWCPAGTFLMGCPPQEQNQIVEKFIDEFPDAEVRKSHTKMMEGEVRHEVTLSKGFWMLETAVTQDMWESVTGNSPSQFKGNKLPVETLSWEDCQRYIEKLNALGVAPKGYQFSLPTESQWEYACRAGTATPFHFGSILNGDKANCNGEDFPFGTSTKGTYLKKAVNVGSYPANAWGLYDMHGNVWEWCSDWHEDYPNGSITDPAGATSGTFRVCRGGSWDDDPRHCRSAGRGYAPPSAQSNNLGLRLALVNSE